MNTNQPTVGRRLRRAEWGSALLVALLLFVFFRFCYSAHLVHREQFSLFLLAPEPLTAYARHPAALARLLGDFLTQFFCFPTAAAVILALTLTLVGVATFRLLSRWLRGWALLPAAALVAVEFVRQCGLTYPLSSSLQLLGLLLAADALVRLLCRGWRRVPLCLLLAVGSVWLFGWGDWSRPKGGSDFRVEQMLAADQDWHAGRVETLQRRLDRQPAGDTYFACWRNLLSVARGRLGETLLDGPQEGLNSLFLPVNPTTPYAVLYAANEAWFLMGDMTNAEHAAMLGMVFSPSAQGARPLMRLAEISLVNGDETAADKYLDLLSHTLLYRRWAADRRAASRTPEVERWLRLKRSLLVQTDCVRATIDPLRSLRHLLDNHPENPFALDYLLAADLLNRDVETFADDYRRYCPQRRPDGVWAEAWLVYYNAHSVPPREVAASGIDGEVLRAFDDYVRQWKTAGGNASSLRDRFGRTYWYYFHFSDHA